MLILLQLNPADGAAFPFVTSSKKLFSFSIDIFSSALLVLVELIHLVSLARTHEGDPGTCYLYWRIWLSVASRNQPSRFSVTTTLHRASFHIHRTAIFNHFTGMGHVCATIFIFSILRLVTWSLWTLSRPNPPYLQTALMMHATKRTISATAEVSVSSRSWKPCGKPQASLTHTKSSDVGKQAHILHK